MENIMAYSSDSGSCNKNSDLKYVSSHLIFYSKETEAPTTHDKGEGKPEISQKEDNNEFEDFQALVESEGLAVDQNLDISDLENKRKRDKANRFYTSNQVSTQKNHVTGHVEEYHLSAAKFDEQFYTFENFGHAQDPTVNRGGNIVHAHKYRNVALNNEAHGPNTKAALEYKKQLKNKRKKEGDPGNEGFLGPWAFYEGEEDFREIKYAPTPEQKKAEETYENKRQQKLEEKQREESNMYQKKSPEQEGEEDKEEDKPAVKSYTIFHGNVTLDKEQGKSFLNPPPYLKPGEHSCYIPKKWVHTWSGHSKGIQAIKFFPKYGHYLLSASHDGRVKLWDVMTNKKCVRTYIGHTESVRAISLQNNSRQFISAGYDKYVQLWDTETGKTVSSYNIKKLPFCCTFNPDPHQQNIFLVGGQNKKILQYDIRTNQVVQKYEEHLGAINSIQFIEDNKKFVSTADDKKIFVWEYGIPIVVKHVSEPDMHAIPASTMHPNRKYFAGQSMDNRVVIYDCKGSFKLNRKKKFTGHKSAGYACGLNFSPDGQFLCSGDAEGKLWFWDWKSGKNYRTMKVHDKVCIDVAWHPIEPSKVATCSWDGTIKLWD